MDITVERTYEFVPVFNENKSEADPIKFKLRQLTTAERQRLMAIDPVKIALSSESGNGVALDVNYEGLFRTAVQKIENLSVNQTKITTAGEFLSSPALGDLLIEVCMEIVQQNGRKDTQLKN